MKLSTKQLAILAHAVAARYEELSAEAQTHVRQMRDEEFTLLADSAGDQVDQVSAELIREGDNATVRRNVKELRELEAARARLAAGEYGVCIDCGQAIGFERLFAQPGALRCLVCQEVFERTHVNPEGALTP